MSDFSKMLGRFSALPWRPGLFILGAAFITATVASTLVAKLFVPGGGGRAVRAAPTETATFAVPSPSASLNQASIDQILKRNIFNSEGAAVETKKDDQPARPSNEAVKSDLPVKLVGTIFGGDPFSGLALVENSQKRTINSFMVGDALLIDKVATLKEVHKERIIIDREGRLEFIEVERVPLVRNPRDKKKKPSEPAAAGLAPIATEPPPDRFSEDGFQRDKAEIVMTETYRSNLLTKDFTKVLQDAKASPNMVDGELRGFCLSRIRKDSIYEKAGLQNDDCINEINGVPLTDTAQAIRLLQSLRNEKEIEVRLNRGGAPQKFTLRIQ